MRNLNPREQRMINKVLQTPDEQIIAILGRGYLASWIASEGFSKAFMILTPKRLYFIGKALGVAYLEQAIEISSISGADIVRSSNIAAKIFLGVFFLPLFTFASVFGFIEESLGLAVFGILFTILIVFTLLFAKPKKAFTIQASAGGISCNARWFSDKELREFRNCVLNSIEDTGEDGR